MTGDTGGSGLMRGDDGMPDGGWGTVVLLGVATVFFLAWNDVQFPGSDALRAIIRFVASMVPG